MDSDKPIYISLLAGIFVLLTIGPVSYTAEHQSSDDCREYDQVFYEDPGDYSSKRIKIILLKTGAEELRDLSDLIPNRSPQGTKAFLIRKPDYMKKGPWNTDLYIFGNKAIPIQLKVTFSEHASYGIRPQWINEKLLSISVSWGRIVSTDIILDVESGEFVYIEDASYGYLIMPCSEKKLMKRKK